MDLKQFEFFSFFDSRAAERLAELSEMLEIKKGGFIFREGDAPDGLYILVDGKIEICREDASGKRFQIALVEPNSYFGEFGVLDGQPRSAAAAAVEDSVLAKISNTDLEKIFAQTSAHSIIRFAADIVEKFRKSNAKYMEERLRQERISMVGQMVGEIIHDYRNPFAVIALATEILGKKTGDEETVKFAGLIAEQVTRMQSMTDELLEFSRGETRFSREAVQVEDFLSHYELLNREYLAKQNVELKVTMIKKTIQADPAKLLRVLQNLTNNAVDCFKGGPGKITVEARDLGDHVSFHVTDNGPGIPPEIAPRIFEAFATFGKKKGTGLGMAITKNVIDAHGGEINFDTAPGKGTTFNIKIPVGA